MGQLVRALKVRGVPVTGVDRMVLTDQLAVQDLLALARFALLPEDDLTLACVLKSPFVGMDEEGLYALAQARSGTLWEALKEDKAFENKGIPVVAWLRGLIARAGTQSPYGSRGFCKSLVPPTRKAAGCGPCGGVWARTFWTRWTSF